MNKYPIKLPIIFVGSSEPMVGESIFDGEGNHIGWIADAVERLDEPEEPDTLKLHERMNAALLDMQDELLAYHPQDRENASSKELIDCVIRAHQIIEDAAVAGVGTCEGSFHESSDLSSGRVPLYHCKGTNKSIFMERDARFCPLCGKRIVSE